MNTFRIILFLVLLSSTANCQDGIYDIHVLDTIKNYHSIEQPQIKVSDGKYILIDQRASNVDSAYQLVVQAYGAHYFAYDGDKFFIISFNGDLQKWIMTNAHPSQPGQHYCRAMDVDSVNTVFLRNDSSYIRDYEDFDYYCNRKQFRERIIRSEVVKHKKYILYNRWDSGSLEAKELFPYYQSIAEMEADYLVKSNSVSGLFNHQTKQWEIPIGKFESLMGGRRNTGYIGRQGNNFYALNKHFEIDFLLFTRLDLLNFYMESTPLFTRDLDLTGGVAYEGYHHTFRYNLLVFNYKRDKSVGYMNIITPMLDLINIDSF